MLISGYNGLNERQAKIPAGSKQRLKQATERLIRLDEPVADGLLWRFGVASADPGGRPLVVRYQS